MKRKKNDCDILLGGVEDVFGSLGECFESALDKKKSKFSVVKSIFKFGGSLTKLAFNTTTCAVKNAPKAVVTVAAVKREIVTAIEEEIHEQRKQAQKDALDAKIKKLQLKGAK